MGVKKVLSPNRKKKYLVLGQLDQFAPAEPDLCSSTNPVHALTAQESSLSTQLQQQGNALNLADNLFLELIVVIGCAIFFRRLWILHGITIVFLRRMLKLGFAWLDFLLDTGVIHEIMSITRHIFKFAFKNTEKALQGDSLRIFFAASWLQNFNSWGHHVWFAILREQYRQVNKSVLSEMEDVMEVAHKMEQRLHKKQQ